MSPDIGLCHIHLSRPEFELDLTFSLPGKGIVGVFGRSGSGKTSLLRCLAGLEKTAQGRVVIDGQCWQDEGTFIPAYKRSVACVFQDSRLFPHLSVKRNLEYGMKRRSQQQAAITWDSVVEMLALDSLLQRYPHQLSGGEAQRVAIGRALLCQPSLLLLDEPLASLDESIKQDILPFLDRVHREVNIPMLYVSHQADEIQRLCDRVMVLEAGKKVFDGSVQQALISPDAPFLKMDNAGVVMDARVEFYDESNAVAKVSVDEGLSLFVPKALETGQQITLQIPASNVSLSLQQAEQSSILNILPGTVASVVDEADYHVTLLVNVSQQQLLARVSKKSFNELTLQPGTDVFVQLKAVSIHDF